MVTVSAASIPLAVWVLSRGLKKRHGVGVCELLRHVCAHLDGVLEVALVPHQDPWNLGAQSVLLALLDPGREAAEAGGVGDIVDKDDSVHVAVVVLHHGLPEALLACSVPQLDLWRGGAV